MKLRKFKAVVNEKGLCDFGASGRTLEANHLIEGKIYKQADQRFYDETGRNSKPFFVDDNGCSRDIEQLIKKGIIEEIF
jgi:hypothetical protein